MKPHLALLPAACGLLAACSAAKPTPEEARAKAERDVALVEELNNAEPPLREVVPDTILLADIERRNMSGLACAYMPGTNAGTRVIAREADAFVKVGGEVMRMAADPASDPLPANSRSLYAGREYSLRLAVEGEGAGRQGKVELRDAWGRTVFAGDGPVDCGA